MKRFSSVRPPNERVWYCSYDVGDARFLKARFGTLFAAGTGAKAGETGSVRVLRCVRARVRSRKYGAAGAVP